jgi:DNA modification methylase
VKKELAEMNPVVRRPIGWLKPAAYNPRKPLKPGDRQYEDLKKSIEHFGHVQAIVANKDGTVIGGHQTLTVLKALGYKEAKCVVLDLKENEEKALNIALNRIEGEWDPGKLAELLVELDASSLGAELTGFNEADIKDLVDARDLGKGDDNDVMAPPKNPKSKRGDLIIMGEHRLLCGDSTSPDDVALLMGGEKADMIFMDPPYGVAYQEKNKMLKRNGKSNGKRSEEPIAGDDGGKDAAKAIVGPAFKNASGALKDGGAYYVCSPQGGELGMMMMMKEAGIACRHMIIWVKDSSVFSMGRLDYDYQHEPILYGWKGSHKFHGAGEHKTSVWSVPRPKASKLHPTMKPIELVENAILNSSQRGEIVLDLFGGSGTTLIAAEQQQRKARLMEIDPAYADVIKTRWEELTGKKAVLQSKGGKEK